MPALPARFAALIITFAALRPALLAAHPGAPGRRRLGPGTVHGGERVADHRPRARDKHYTDFHRVLSWTPWSARGGARILLGHLVRSLAPRGPVILGVDDTIERRWGRHISARGIYRDPVRSSHSHFVKKSGLRWISLMLLSPVPWAERVWARS